MRRREKMIYEVLVCVAFFMLLVALSACFKIAAEEIIEEIRDRRF